jgi:nucleoside transporter
MNLRVRIELSVMMFIQFFVWGAWYVTMGSYLGKAGLNFSGPAFGAAYSATSWAAVLSPFFIGMVADRFFAAQKVLGVLHLVGAALMYYVSTITSPGLFFWAVLAYALTYMPTLALVNAIAFNQMTSTEKEFPQIRVLGTLGWVVAGAVITGWGWARGASIEATALPMKLAAGASILMGLYSFLLPNTPPKSQGKTVTVSDILGLEALKLLKDRSFAVFAAGSLLVCIPLAFYYTYTNNFLNDRGLTGVALKMTMGQMSEVFFMLVMPFFFIRLGVKKMLLIGMLAWVIRYVLFAFGNNGPLVSFFYTGILLHGICYDFFFVTGQIYVDKCAPKKIQAAAQGLIAMITYGFGMAIGANLSGWIVEKYTTRTTIADAVVQIADGVKTVLFQGAPLPVKDDTVTLLLNGKETVANVVESTVQVVTLDWQTIWLIPAVMAGVVMVIFALLFKDRPANGERAA